ncbi:hypothetical protein SARC_13981, partial [Sphaeroforma arctica JP610]
MDNQMDHLQQVSAVPPPLPKRDTAKQHFVDSGVYSSSDHDVLKQTKVSRPFDNEAYSSPALEISNSTIENSST